jgi:hypothetical protein
MNSKLFKVVALSAVLVVLLGACGVLPSFGSGDLIREEREVSGFDRIDVSGGGDLVIVQDGTESVTIETDDNLMQYVTAEVKNGTLELYLDNQGMRSFIPSKLIFTVHVKDLRSVNTSGSWDVTSEQIETDSLDILVSGSGDIVIRELNAENLAVTFSGSGEMEAAGEVGQQTLSISGSGKFHHGDLRCGTAQIDISGSGDATLWVTDNLAVDISGSGSVEYYGNPETQVNTSGSGDVQRLGEKEN